MPGIEAQAKAGTEAVKKNWLFFAAALVAVAIGLLWYEHKSGGKLTTKFAGLPLVGKLFA